MQWLKMEPVLQAMGLVSIAEECAASERGAAAGRVHAVARKARRSWPTNDYIPAHPGGAGKDRRN